MTDIALHNGRAAALQPIQDANLARLEAWAQHAVTVRKMAEGIVNTSFCPKAYRGKPDEATAAVLAGAEMGLSPMAALRAFDDIQGTPAPKAITLRAVVQSRGHDLEVVEADNMHAVVEGRRKGSQRWQRLEWTIERATLAGYVSKNPKWKTDPTAMLVARATAEMARWLDSAAIMGMPYSAEELSDEGIEGHSVTQRVTAADIVGAAVEHTAGAIEPAPAYTAETALADIAAATTQAQLDDVKADCQAAGLRDQGVLDAWVKRSAELAEQPT